MKPGDIAFRLAEPNDTAIIAPGTIDADRGDMVESLIGDPLRGRPDRNIHRNAGKRTSSTMASAVRTPSPLATVLLGAVAARALLRQALSRD